MILLISLREINKIAGYRGLRASAFGLPWRTAFEKKFIYGIFGLSEREAAMADVLIPASIITAPVGVYLGGFYLKKAVSSAYTKLPQMIESYQMMQRLDELFKSGQKSKDEAMRLMHGFFERHNKNILNSFPKPLLKAVPTANKLVPPSNTLKFLQFASSGKNRFFSRFIPGVIVGGMAIQACHMLMDNDEPKLKK